jgi:secretion/DNA translocation related TadE-like protein
MFNGKAILPEGKSSTIGCEHGAGVVMVLGMIGAAIALFICSVSLANLTWVQLKLQQTAETAAIDSANALRGLSTGYPCEVAEQISTENMANLESCRIVGFGVLIQVRSEALGIVLSAKALAGAE